MSDNDRAAVEAAIRDLGELADEWLAWFDGDQDWDPPVSMPERRSEIADHLRQVRTVLAELKQLRKALADVDMTFKLGHGGAWCVACHGAMREGTTVVKTLAVVCEPCAADLAATAVRLDPSRLAARNERNGEPHD